MKKNTLLLTKSQNELLDKALFIIRNKDNKFDTTFNTAAIVLTAKELGLSVDTAKALLDILVENGHAYYSESEYKISARGVLFNENKGYVKESKQENMKLFLTVFNSVLLTVSALGLLIFEFWKVWHHLNYE
jgi:hypothetical protein